MLTDIIEAFFKVDKNGCFTYVDVHGAKDCACAHQELIGKNIWEAFPDCRGSVFEKEYRIAMEQRIPRTIEARYEPRAGIWAEGRAYPMEDGGLALYFRDTTRRKTTENVLEKMCDRKDEFLAVLAHELRNHLAPLSNALYVLTAEKVDKKIRKNSSDLMAQQIKQMARIVDDLMDVARIGRGKIELRKKKIKLSEPIENALNLVRPVAEKAGHRLIAPVVPDSLYIDADPVRIVQIFANLLNNAVKYTPPGGCITVRVETHGDRVLARIEDTGIGIPRDRIASIFDMFSQVENAMDYSQGGLGIGLALVKNLVSLHGGQIQVRSDGPGTGSEFIVDLPLVEKPQEVETLPQKSGIISNKPCRVLVVDDNKECARTLGWTVEVLGHTAHVAFDGPQAIKAVESFRPDVILLDISLPGMNGYEVLKEMKQNPILKDTLFIAQTGWGQKEHRILSHQVGFDDYLVKPLKINDVERILSTPRRVSEPLQKQVVAA